MLLILFQLLLSDVRNSYQSTPLHFAARSGCLGSVQALLLYRADVNVLDQWGERPIHWAAFSGNVECLTLLLESTPHPHDPNSSGSTPLHITCRYG